MTLLVINAGSSSVKATCFREDGLQVLAKGMVERIGTAGASLHFQTTGKPGTVREVEAPDTFAAVEILADCLLDPKDGVLNAEDQVDAVGHRVVHGGEKISETVIINNEVKAVITGYFSLAPLHNPPNLQGIEAAEKCFPRAVQVGVFDTAFHASMPSHAYLYALPHELYSQDGIRRYGFHGTSHQYVARAAARHLGRPLQELKIITCHLGNGCSITAVDGGRSIDTSMGFTPLEGLIMGTRCGDLDPAIVFHLLEHKEMSPAQVRELLNEKSGLLGLAGVGSGDLRDIIQAKERGDAQADRALLAFAYRLKKYIGAYTAVLGGLDALVFTAGIGENSPVARALACQGLEALGLALDESKNQASEKGPRQIQAEDSRVKVLVIPTDEELAIARQVVRLLETEQAAGR